MIMVSPKPGVTVRVFLLELPIKAGLPVNPWHAYSALNVAVYGIAYANCSEYTGISLTVRLTFNFLKFSVDDY